MAKHVYLGGSINKKEYSFSKVNTKGGRKRVFDKLVNRKPKDPRSEYLDAQQFVMQWEYENRDLFPNKQ